MRSRLALAVWLVGLAAAAFAAGGVEVRPAGPELLGAMQAALALPQAPALSGGFPGLEQLAAFDAAKPGDLEAAGLLAAYLPADFARKAASADLAERAQALAQLRTAYAQAAPMAEAVVEARVSRLRRLRAAGKLGEAELSERLKGLEAFSLFGEAPLARARAAAGETLRRKGLTVVNGGRALAASLQDGSRPAGETAALPSAGAAPAVSARSPAAARTSALAGQARLRPSGGRAAPAKPMTLEALAGGKPVLLRLATDVRADAPLDTLVTFEVLDDVSAGGAAVIRRGATAFGRVVDTARRSLTGKAGYVTVRPTYAIGADGSYVSLAPAELKEWTPPTSPGTYALLVLLPILGLFLAWLFAPLAELPSGREVSTSVDDRRA